MAKIRYVPVSEEETTELMKACGQLDLAFGPRGVALKWEEGTPLPASIRHLGLMRGVLNENMDGAGI